MIPSLLRYPPGGKPWLLYALLAGSAAFNIGVLVRYGSHSPEATPVTPVSPESPAPIVAIGEDTTVSNPAVAPTEVPPLPQPKGSESIKGTYAYSGMVNRTLSDTFQGAQNTNPAALSAVYTRLFAWDVDMRRDLHKGDVVEVLYEQAPGVEPVILAARLHLQPGTATERVLSAYRYQAPGDAYPSYWNVEGKEVPRRLIDGPLDNYEQITSLLKDRPTHEGMDFKTNLGTPVETPRAGTVTRMDWNHAANGNCIEVQYSDGTTAKFLHLNENLVKVGQHLSAGTVIGKTGNTGHSTGPHLHYQLETGSKVIDPITYHGTLRRQLQPEAMPDFQKQTTVYDQQLGTAVAANQ